MAISDVLKSKLRYKYDRAIDRIFSRSPTYNDSLSLHLCTCAWGSHLELFFDVAMPSLLQAGNVPHLIQNSFKLNHTIYTPTPDIARELLYKFKKRHHKDRAILTYLDSLLIVQIAENDFHDMPLSAVRRHMKSCLDSGSYFMLAPPDQFLGNYSLTNAFLSILGKNIWFSAGHPRVKQDILQHQLVAVTSENKAISNSELVSLAMKNLHASCASCYDGQFQGFSTNTTHVGLSLRQISDKIYCCIHNLPSPWLGWATERDVEYFEASDSFNNWDRQWLRILTLENRVKVSGSSDLFFTIELTPKGSNLSEKKANQLNNDLSVSTAFHNTLMNHFISIWRAS